MQFQMREVDIAPRSLDCTPDVRELRNPGSRELSQRREQQLPDQLREQHSAASDRALDTQMLRVKLAAELTAELQPDLVQARDVDAFERVHAQQASKLPRLAQRSDKGLAREELGALGLEK